MVGELAAPPARGRVRAQAAIDRLREIVKALQRGRFGRRSERLDDGQLQLGLEDLDADIARVEASALPGHDRTNRAGPSPADRVALPAHLPRRETTGDIASSWRACRRRAGSASI